MIVGLGILPFIINESFPLVISLIKLVSKFTWISEGKVFVQRQVVWLTLARLDGFTYYFICMFSVTYLIVLMLFLPKWFLSHGKGRKVFEFWITEFFFLKGVSIHEINVFFYEIPFVWSVLDVILFDVLTCMIFASWWLGDEGSNPNGSIKDDSVISFY